MRGLHEKEIQLTNLEQFILALGIVNGVRYLHGAKMILCSLTLRHCLLGDNNVVKVRFIFNFTQRTHARAGTFNDSWPTFEAHASSWMTRPSMPCALAQLFLLNGKFQKSKKMDFSKLHFH